MSLLSPHSTRQDLSGGALEEQASPGEESAPPGGRAGPRPSITALRRWARRWTVVSSADESAPYIAPFLALRWTSLTVALLLALLDHRGWRAVVAGGTLAAYALWRTVWPVRYRRSRVTTFAISFEVALYMGAVALTRFGDSPFLVCLAAAIFIAGFVGGLRLVSALAVASAVAMVLPEIFAESYRHLLGSSVQLAFVLVLLGAVGGLARHLAEASGGDDAGAHPLRDLTEVNDLLYALHGATERLVLPLDLTSSAQWVLERLDEIIQPDTAAVLLCEEGAVDPRDARWTIVASSGHGRVDWSVPLSLPSSLLAAAAGRRALAVGEPFGPLAAGTRSAAYCPLRAGDRLVGMLSAECMAPRQFGTSELARIDGVAAAGALALDSARWLRRLQTLAVEEERARLARELHDHIGQSIVYLGFELDRLTELNAGRAVQKDLVALRGEIRDVVSELRDTLVELRTDVTETQSISRVLGDFVERVNRRSDVTVEFVDLSQRRAPVSVEREFWRVAQEAVVNALKHARAQKVSVVWDCDDRSMGLEVEDDGVGLPAGAGRQGSPGFGIVGMRERADAIGAQFEITSEPGRGTLLTMRRATRRSR